jgi:hypothetical protein
MKLENNDTNIALLRKLKKLGKFIDNETLVLENPKIIIKLLKKDEEIIGFDVEEDKKGLKFIKELLLECEVVTSADIKPWPELTLDNLKTAEYSKVFYDRKKFLKIISDIKKLKCSAIFFDKKLSKDFICNDISIYFNPIFENMDSYDTIKSKEAEIKIPKKDYAGDTDILDDKKVKARYYRKRNCIVMYVNPFTEDITEMYNGLKTKKENVEDFKMFNLTKEFTKNIEVKLKENDRRLKENMANIESYQQNIFDFYKHNRLMEEEVEAFKHMKENFGKSFIEEINKTKALKIVENVDYTLNEVIVTYKPTCITKADFQRVTKHGKRSMYIGSIKLRIGYNYVRVDNDLKLCKYKDETDPNSEISEYVPHPHAHGDGQCCLGADATKNTIYSLQAQLKISELALYFWMFVKNYGDDGGYLKPLKLYDFCLMNGYPVFDEKGQQIYINDAKRIDTNEQIKLKKSKDYDENIKKFKDFKPW